MKILHILNLSIPIHCGYSFRTQAILENQRQRGWETAHITSEKHEWLGDDEQTVDGLHFYRTPPSKSLFSRLPVFNQIEVIRSLQKRICSVIEKEAPDILHAHSPALTGVAALKAGAKFNLPVLYECRAFWEDAAVDQGTSREGGPRYRLTRALENHVFKNCGAITTICEGLRDDIVSRGIPGDKVTVIPNAIDTDRFNPNLQKDTQLEMKLDLEDSETLGFIGSFFGYEGLSLLLDAMPLILMDNPKVKLLLVGGGEQEANLKRQVKEQQLESHVIFSGRVPHDQVSRYYSLVDIFVYPRISIRLTELVTPLKPLEAMAQNKLVVASDIGGHRELITHEETGWLFKESDPAALAACIAKALSSPGAWDQVKEKARTYVQEQRNWKFSVARYQGVYENLLNNRP